MNAFSNNPQKKVINNKEQQDYLYKKRENLFTQAEQAFLQVLFQAIDDDMIVFGKVRIADVLNPISQNNKSLWRKALNQITAKHFDFVICKKRDLSFVCAIELDDSSHNAKNRKQRDIFVNNACESAQLPLVRFKAKAGYKVGEIKDKLETEISSLK